MWQHGSSTSVPFLGALDLQCANLALEQLRSTRFNSMCGILNQTLIKAHSPSLARNTQNDSSPVVDKFQRVLI